MKRIKLTKTHERTLREQVIDTERPGPVLRDFHVVLDYVGVQGVKAAGKHNLLPIESIGELDERLSQPLRLDLKRPQLRSHPYLCGLHLLLRASGLSRLVGAGGQTRLVLDPPMLAQWDQLNPTEQYFTLLEAWLHVARPEMIGDQGRAFGGLLLSCAQTWQYLPATGERYNTEKPQQVYVSFLGRDFYQLALMDLFGLLEVEQPPRSITPWCPAAIRHVPFGDAVLTLLTERELAGDAILFEEDTPSPPRFDEWQPIFQPYFPAWRQTLQLPEAAPRDGTFLFRVSLGKVWRLIALRARDTLDDLVYYILKSVDFDSDHLYEFRYRDRLGRALRAVHPFVEEDTSAAEVHIGELPLGPGESMTLVYDFGDNWQFTVKLESIAPPDAKLKAPRIVESHGKAPEQYPSWDE